ncbi:hypothetical protein L484_019071 [Morus notabilis]|uniref:TCP domain-containing protein n=1 Tax=Morus notabilis TaxID=981085 RepID=W9RZ98_9ROSA|nr:transcription factor TCP5 [Morus notabilis]XP_024027284.1 transcription factor TCP5 [Morus notabilis]EXC04473.1 hypothetical protein L484_019071 [Morus notabilis]
MITSPKEKDFPAAKRDDPAEDKKLYKAPSASSRQWSSAGFRNPRIVRVSRTFGGKDRHSKVCTVRGLRDRRIRLSVPTAVQLYDLQDRLGLSQPSKVIDWLIDATKLDIDKLPPLQIPQGVLGQFLHHHNNHDHHHHQHLHLLDPHHDQVKTNEQDQFAQKLFGVPSSYMNHYQNYTDQTSFYDQGIALPGQYFDGISGHNNLVMSTTNSSTTSSFNSGSIQSVSQLFFCAPPPSNSTTTTSFFTSTPYPSYMSSTTQYHENPHDTIRPQMINNHIQFMSANSSTISSTSASSSSSSSQQFHILNNSLMASLHTTSVNNNNNNNNPPLIKSFPAILHPRLLAQSSAYENRQEKDRSTTSG